MILIFSSQHDVWEGGLVGHSVRPESASVVSTLQALGIQVWLVTGDNVGTAEAVAQVRSIGWMSTQTRSFHFDFTGMHGCGTAVSLQDTGGRNSVGMCCCGGISQRQSSRGYAYPGILRY